MAWLNQNSKYLIIFCLQADSFLVLDNKNKLSTQDLLIKFKHLRVESIYRLATLYEDDVYHT